MVVTEGAAVPDQLIWNVENPADCANAPDADPIPNNKPVIKFFKALHHSIG
jgi:hypothetical protein